jgi:integral membrane protein (TIGR00529 family)
METFGTYIALAKIGLGFSLILFGVYRKWGLWLSILLGAVATGFLFGMGPTDVALSLLRTAHEPKFLSIGGIVACILLLSSVQEFTGQGHRLVAGLAQYMRSPRLRLIFFPALIGLLPMPGGAVFSCPMVRDMAEGANIPVEKQALINYWFRHIWEISWPLYPGYILACILADIPISLLWRYTWPIVLISLTVGLLYYLRQPVEAPDAALTVSADRPSLGTVLLEGLPILVAIVGMPFYYALFSLADIDFTAEIYFIFSLLTAVATATVQTRLALKKIAALLFSPGVVRMMLVIYTIYSFKDIVIGAHVIDSIAGAAASPLALLCLFCLLPVVSGLLTGLMAGFVGTSFPLLMGLLWQMGLGDDRLTWTIFALIAGNLGQMSSPIHACFIVTAEFFHVSLPRFWRGAVVPACMQFVLASLYVAFLHFVVQARL